MPDARSIHLGQRQTLGRREIVRQSNARLVLLGLFLEFATGDHHRHRGMSDQVVGERSQEDPLECTASSSSDDHQRWFEFVNLRSTVCQRLSFIHNAQSV